MDCKRPKKCLGTLVRRRPMYTKEEIEGTPLNRCLNVYHLTFCNVTGMAGSGIYVLTGSLIGNVAGAAACISYIIGGISAAFTAMCYAEFATLIPRTGSVYIYTYLMLGELPAFIIGWTSASDVIVGIASVSKAFSGTVNALAENAIQNWTLEHIGSLPHPSEVFSPTPDFVAFGMVLIMMVITAIGVHASMTFNSIMSILQITSLLILSVGCYIYGSTDSWSAQHGGFAPYGVQGIINAATITVYAYVGFDSIANASEETINPKKTIPRAMLASLIIVSVLYFTASFGLAMLVPKELIDFSSPFVFGFQRLHVQWLVILAGVGSLLCTGAAKLMTMFSLPRIFYAMASDGLLFRFFATVEKRTQVPQISLFFGGGISCLLAFFFNIQTLANFLSLGMLLSYFFIGVDIMVLRYIYVMPVHALTSASEEEDKKVKPTSRQDESREYFVPLRKRFQGLGEKFPVIRKRGCFVLLLCIYISLCFVFALVFNFNLMEFSPILIGWSTFIILLVITSGMTLSIYQPTFNDEVYQSPLMPIVPLMAVAINAILITRLSPLTWLRFVIWSIIGLLIYGIYGWGHSVMANSENVPLRPDVDESKGQNVDYGTRTFADNPQHR